MIPIKNITIIGSGNRVIKVVLPSLCKINNLNINQIVSITNPKLINIKEFKREFQTVNFKDIVMDKVDLIYLAVRPNSISEILKRLINTFDVSEKIIIVDTPPIQFSNIFELKLFKKFKSIYVLEDMPFTPLNLEILKIIKSNQIGKIKRINLFNNGFFWHAFAQIKRFLDINSFDLIFWSKLSNMHRRIIFYSGLKEVANIYEPKDYAIGRTQIIGSSGDINDFEMYIKSSEYNNFTIKHNIKNNQYLGFSIFKNNEIYIQNNFKKKLQLDKNIKNRYQIYNIQKSLGIINFQLILDQSDLKEKDIKLYSLKEAFYDYLITYFLRFKIIVDLKLPILRKSLINLFIDLLLIK